MTNLVEVVKILRDGGVTGMGIIAAFHRRRLAALGAQNLRMFEMAEGTFPAGTVMAAGALDEVEIVRQVKEALDVPRDFDILGHIHAHPPMRPDENCVKLVSLFSSPYAC